MPRADNFPEIEVILCEVPCKTNPLGVKGAGEAGAVGSAPATMNALADALLPAGIQHVDMPATPQKVWDLLNGASALAAE
jgi:carbon-monoxide dehydrogenase large subunit